MINELQAAKELAIQAGAILLEYYSASPSIEWKGTNNPVTTADKAASRFLVDEIKRRFPSDGILCEEEQDDSQRLDRARVWMIDPMDGTKEFISHRGEFSVMIGLAIDGRPVVGAVYQPTEGKLYHAAAGHGAFVETADGRRPLQVSQESDLSKITIAVSRSHHSGISERIINALGVQHILHSGSSGLKVGLICERKADLYIHPGPGTSQWDSCAPDAIIHEAGGRMTNISNLPMTYNTADRRNLEGIVASNGVIHDRVIDVIRRTS
jgi:3'(2'), 5'-bisphosphate nucleotidase